MVISPDDESKTLAQLFSGDGFLKEHAVAALAHQRELSSYSPGEEDLRYLSQVHSEKRKTQFLLGRLAASRALEKLSYHHLTSIPISTERYPIFPAQITGSISHTEVEGESLAVCAAARTSQLRSIGTDIEVRSRSLVSDIREKIFTPQEREEHGTEPSTVLKVVTAKEALFKALYPLCHVFFYFQDAKVTFFGEKITATLLKDLTPEFQRGFSCEGRVFESAQLIIAITWVQR